MCDSSCGIVWCCGDCLWLRPGCLEDGILKFGELGKEWKWELNNLF